MSKKSRSSSSSAAPAVACPSCGLEHSAEERFCRDCGMPLVAAGDEEPLRDERHERVRKIRPEFTHGALHRVAGAQNQAEAELIQNILLEEGVPSVVRRGRGSDVPDFLAAGARDLMVPESGLGAARAALNISEDAPSSSRYGPSAFWIVVALLAMAGVAALVAWAITQA
jgi:hypothetical protein